jgi:hypothetical protein
MAELFFSAEEMGFQGAERQAERGRGFFVGAAALVTEGDRGPFRVGKQGDGLLKVHRQPRRGRNGGFFTPGRKFIGPVERGPAPRLGEKQAIADAAQPGAPGGVAAISLQLLPGAEEGLLRQIVRRRVIVRGEPAQEMAQELLVPGYQAGVCLFVAVLKHARDQFRVGGIVHEGSVGPGPAGGFSPSLASTR